MVLDRSHVSLPSVRFQDLESTQSPYEKNELHLQPQETHCKDSVFSAGGRVYISDEMVGSITGDGPNYCGLHCIILQ